MRHRQHPSKNAGAANAKFIARGPAGEKTCSRCRQLRRIEQFNVDRTRFDGRSYICKTCKGAERTAPGPSQVERRARAADGLRWCRACNAWRIDVRAGICKPCTRAENRARYARDPEVRRRAVSSSMARKRKLQPIPTFAIEELFESFGGKCAYCDNDATTIDHIMPISKGGISEPANVAPCCKSCNSSKNNRDLWEWLETTGRTPRFEFFERLVLQDALLFPPRGNVVQYH